MISIPDYCNNGVLDFDGMSDEVKELWEIFGNIDILEPPLISEHGSFIFRVNGKDIIVGSRKNSEMDMGLLLSEFVNTDDEHCLEFLVKDIIEFFSMTISDTPQILAQRLLDICVNERIVISDKSVNDLDIYAWLKDDGYLFIYTDSSIQ